MPSRVGATAMETLVDDQSGVTQDQMSPTHMDTSIARSSVSPTIAQVRANGTVVLGTTNSVKHVTTSSTQAIAVPQPGGAVSIVHVSIPNQPVHVQSVIQQGPNQQSVIQAPSGATLQSLPKNVILLNKVTGQGSVIHSTDGESGVHPVQLIAAASSRDDLDSLSAISSAEEESRKRREILARRPSYRKILSDLSATDQQESVKEEHNATLVAEASQDSDGTITVSGTQYHTTGLLKAIQLATASQDGSLQGLQTLTMTNSGAGATGAIVQYAQGQDGQFFVPVTVSAADLQAYQIRTTGSNTPQGVVMTSSSTLQSQQQLAEEASRKRELRLLKNRSAPDESLGHTEKRELRLFKNREAAKECRRKKKEYIKCLENRVAVLENQNKALIEELKSLKELYCQKND